MNFLIDANLPCRLANVFRERGHYAIHTLDLPDGNATLDMAILQYADEQNCVITTKDSDFTTSFWLNDRPEKLLIANFDQIIADLSSNRFVELTREHVIVHA
jgi:predicted nuclease of predicted toxin-antitoxin system